MKGLEKLTSVRLAEVLSQKGAVPTEAITDALYAQEKGGEPFVQILVSGGHITEWDLAKVVTESFQLPFIMASSYDISDETKDRLPKETLFSNLLVPLDIFDDVMTVVMPILTPFEVLRKIQRECKVLMTPYVGLISENKKVLGEMFKDFNAWLQQEQKRREKVAESKRKRRSSESDSWMSIFDAGDQAIQETLGDGKK